MNNNNLKINGQSGFVVVDQAPIQLNWSPDFKQIACQIRITKGIESVYENHISSNQCSFSVDALDLEANTDYTIEVSVFGLSNKTSLFKRGFRSGNLGNFSGEWIYSGSELTQETEFYSPRRNTVIRKHIQLDSIPEAAYIYIVGLGYYHLYINGKRVSDYELNNDWTNYDKTVCYDTLDISAFLKPGNNEVFVELGNGWYNPAPLTLFGKYNLRSVLTIGEPKLLADVMLCQNGEWATIATDTSWQVSEGAYLSNNLYLGETYDFNLLRDVANPFEFVDSEWKNAVVTTGPAGKLIPSYIPKIKQGNSVQPRSVVAREDGSILVDFGQTIAGFIDLSLQATSGQEIELCYGEELTADGKLNTDSTLAGFVGKQVAEDFQVPGGEGAPERAEQIDRIVTVEGSLRYVNAFCFHSFRYVEVKGLDLSQITAIKAIYVHTRLPEVGSFRCSDPYLNKLYKIAKVTKKNNLHSVFGDCARERLAYGGDIVALAQSQLYVFDTDAMYRKTIHDFLNDVRENGGMPETAPFMGIKTNGTGDGAGPLAWQLVVAYLVSVHYQHYGNASLVQTTLPYIEKQIAHLASLSFETISKSCLGDWGSVAAKSDDYKSSSPALAFTSACFYYYHLILAKKFSAILQLDEKVELYANQAEELKKVIVAEYQNEDGSFADKSQTSYVFALYFELTDKPHILLDTLIEMIKENDGQLTCGIFGQSFAYDIFAKHAVPDVVRQWLYCEHGFPAMLSSKGNALREFFGQNKNGSCNHAMFSSYVSWFYQGLAGIQVHSEAQGADKIIIRPTFEEGIHFVDCCYNTVKGNITSHWSRHDESIELHIQVPNNLEQCILILEQKYSNSVQHLNVINTDRNNIYIDISHASTLDIVLQSVEVVV